MLSHTVFSLSTLAAIAQASCLHATSLMPRSLNARAEVAVSNFGYTALNGPLNWAGLDPNVNSICSRGKLQSPINLDDSVGRVAAPPTVDIPAVQSAEFENLGSTVEVIVNGTTTLGGTQFSLQQFHFHSPSEHRINDEYFPLEMHMVHQAENGGIAVMTVLFQLDATNSPVLDVLNAHLEEIRAPGSVTTTGALDFTQISQHLMTTPLRQYTGSLTTPPCSEGVTFVISESPLPVNVETFNRIKSVVKYNSRFTQNTAGADNLLARNGGLPASQ